MSPASAVFRRSLGDARVRTLSFALVFAFAAATQAASYRSAYPTLADRLQLARTFGDNAGTRLLYGVPHDLLTTGGWLSRRLGTLPGHVDPGGAAYLALALVTPALVFAGVGAVASQLAPTRRGALALGGGVLAAALLLRMVADTSDALSWLRWATPLGWAEELRPFVGAQPPVLVLPVLTTALLLAVAARIAARRDVGAGLLPARDSAAPRLGGLSSPVAQALRGQRGVLLGWLAGVSAVAVILGALSASVSEAISGSLEEQVRKLGVSIDSASGFLGIEFLFLVVAICVFVCFQVSAAREEEAEQRLETLLALPVGRRRWLAGRLVLATGAAAGLALAAGVLAWAGAAAAGAGVSLGDLLRAAANALPPALLFLGIGALLYAFVPRASAGIAFALVGVSFLWDTIGSLAEVPGWVVGLSPFHHVALVPAEPVDLAGAAAMLVLAALAVVAALRVFERRDLLGA